MTRRLIAQTFLAMLVGLFAVPTISFAAEPTLAKVKIQYHTTKDDKDSDTQLFTYEKFNKETIAQLENYAGTTKFDNNSNSPDFELKKVNTKITKAQIKKGVQAKIKMETKDGGDDNWWFKFTLSFEFSDKSVVTMDSKETRFDNDERTEQDFDLEP